MQDFTSLILITSHHAIVHNCGRHSEKHNDFLEEIDESLYF